MRILVTGGAGFIGSHIVESYLDLGHEVVVADDLSTGKLENVDQHKCTFVQLDISNRDHVEYLREFGPFDVINHQAAQMSVSDSMKDPHKDIRINIMGTVNILSVLAPTCKRFIFASSGGTVYGEHDCPRVERDHLEPVSPYGISKLACEKYVHMYSKQFMFNYTILRYANVYGPRQNPHGEAGVIAIFLEKILKGETCTINGDGEYFRDYVHVSDVVLANIRALGFDAMDGIHNVSTGRVLTTNDIWEAITSNPKIQEMDPKFKHGQHRQGDIRFSCCVPGRIQHKVPTIHIEQGMNDTINWYLKNSLT